MDRVRLGRVLGRGARLAARTAVEALDAATTPNPPRRSTSGTRPATEILGPVRPATTTRSVPPRAKSEGRRTSTRGAGMFTPFVRASRAVTLEVAGSFFALFALPFGLGMWHARAEIHGGLHGMSHLLAYAAVAGFFLYCSISSFMRARRLP